MSQAFIVIYGVAIVCIVISQWVGEKPGLFRLTESERTGLGKDETGQVGPDQGGLSKCVLRET